MHTSPGQGTGLECAQDLSRRSKTFPFLLPWTAAQLPEESQWSPERRCLLLPTSRQDPASWEQWALAHNHSKA